MQDLQEFALQDEQPEDVCFSTPLIPNKESFFTTLLDAQLVQAIDLLLKTNCSNSFLQSKHLYSKIGILISPSFNLAEGIIKDKERDDFMVGIRLRVLIFSDRDIFKNLNGVMETIWKSL